MVFPLIELAWVDEDCEIILLLPISVNGSLQILEEEGKAGCFGECVLSNGWACKLKLAGLVIQWSVPPSCLSDAKEQSKSVAECVNVAHRVGMKGSSHMLKTDFYLTDWQDSVRHTMQDPLQKVYRDSL